MNSNKCALVIYTEKGRWYGSFGYPDLENLMDEMCGELVDQCTK